MMKRVIALASFLIAAACMAPHTKRYFQLELPSPGSTDVPLEITLLVGQVEVDELYDDFRIIYRLSPYEVNYYAYDFWAEKPSELIWDAIYYYLADRRAVRQLLPELLKEEPDWVLRVKVQRIEEVDSGTILSARLAMDMEVVEFKSERLLASRAFDRTVQLPGKDVAELPGVLSRILGEEIEGLLNVLGLKAKTAAEHRRFSSPS